jgi:hypothetical protein
MKKFIYKLITFVSTVLAIAWLIQILVDIRIKHKVLYGFDNLDVTERQANDLVFLGSSRCYSHFDPSLFLKGLQLKAVNLGIDGHSELTMHRLRLQNYLARNKPPRFVILNFDPLIAAGSMEDNRNVYNKDRFARYCFFPSTVNEPIIQYFHFNVIEKYIPLYAILRYRKFFLCLTLPYDKQWRMEGYNKHDENWDTVAEPLTKWEAFPREYFDTSIVSLNGIKEQLKELDILCRQHQIRLICVQTPIYKSVYRQSNFAYPKEICSQLDIPFFDLNSEQINNDINNFYNADHLNTKGVTKMTAELLSRPGFIQLMKHG